MGNKQLLNNFLNKLKIVNKCLLLVYNKTTINSNNNYKINNCIN